MIRDLLIIDRAHENIYFGANTEGMIAQPGFCPLKMAGGGSWHEIWG